MKTCRACGGVLGRDCFNEKECMDISFSAADQHTSQIQSELDWERNVVVPDLEGKLSSALIAVRDLATMLQKFDLDPADSDFVKAQLQFYNEHIGHREREITCDENDLPF